MNAPHVLSHKDAKRRELILSGNLWRVLLQIGLPLALFESLNQLFKLLDSMMASHVSALSVSAVSYLSQINTMLSAIGGGLAIGASIKISEAYGAGDYPLVHKRISTLFALCAGISVVSLAIIPFTVPILRLAGTPEEFISIGAAYFAVSMLSVVLTYFNTAYIAIERARGNSKRILILNLTAIAVKLSTTAFFVYILHSGITMIAVASVISDSVLFIACVYHMRDKNSVFGFDRQAISKAHTVLRPMLFLSFPVMAEKAAFSFGKVVVNSMSALYGGVTVGALGISNNIGGITTNPQNGFQQAGAAVISQNIGAGQQKRALSAFYRLFVLCVAVGAIGYAFTMSLLVPISHIFAAEDAAFAQLIRTVYRYEAFGAIPLGANAAVMALLYGFGYTKLTLLINFSRVFILRVPVLWALQQFTDLGSQSVGIVMMVSNIGTGIAAIVVAAVVIIKIQRGLKKEADLQ